MFTDQAPIDLSGVDTLIVLEAEGRVGRSTTTSAGATLSLFRRAFEGPSGRA